MSNPDGYFGTQTAESRGSEYNAMVFVIRQLLATRCHVALVKVIAVSAGMLDVQPMVNQLDADGNAVPHGVISGVPYFTLQAGGNAVTLVPEVGDKGLCVFADRDISSAVSNRDISNPGSMRQCDMADGLYLGGFLNDAPTQYVDFSADGIHIHSPSQVKLTAPTIVIEAETLTMDVSGATTITAASFTVNAPATFSGTIDAAGIITAPDVIAGGKSGASHRHGQVRAGSDISGGPT